MGRDPESRANSTHKELEGQERLESLALAAGLTRPQLVMLISLLALNSPRTTSSLKEKASFPASRSKRRRSGKFRTKA